MQRMMVTDLLDVHKTSEEILLTHTRRASARNGRKTVSTLTMSPTGSLEARGTERCEAGESRL
jgi:hypothetical protein